VNVVTANVAHRLAGYRYRSKAGVALATSIDLCVSKLIEPVSNPVRRISMVAYPRETNAHASPGRYPLLRAST
jgi:hypothetical protein